jgi:predicted P-loop ATPase
VNPTEFLLDDTGNRRYWVIPVTQRIDIAQVKELRNQLWAAAVALYKKGEAWHLTEAEEAIAAQENKQFEVDDVWTAHIAEWLANPSHLTQKDGEDYALVSEIIDKCLEN